MPASAKARRLSRGAEIAVLVPIREWKRLRDAAHPSVKELLLSASTRSNLPLPVRGRAKRRSTNADC
jgi:hypothetical protein